MKNKALLFLNGEIPIKLPDLTNYSKIYCTDGSYNYLKKLGIKPNVISGDFDSVDWKNVVPEGIDIIETPDQNFTDFEKSLQLIINDHFVTLDVYGASGKQQDHFVGNLCVALKYKSKIEITFIDNYSVYYFISNDFKLSNVKGKIISLLPFPEADGIVTEGLQYPLNNEKLTLIERIGTRNKAISDTITIKYSTGDLIVFIMD